MGRIQLFVLLIPLLLVSVSHYPLYAQHYTPAVSNQYLLSILDDIWGFFSRLMNYISRMFITPPISVSSISTVSVYSTIYTTVPQSVTSTAATTLPSTTIATPTSTVRATSSITVNTTIPTTTYTTTLTSTTTLATTTIPVNTSTTTLTSTTTSATTMNSTTTIPLNAQIYGPADEISNVSLVYPNATLDVFSCNTDSDCVIVRTQSCFNNLADQQACINNGYSGVYASYYESFLANNSAMCPLFFIPASASCSCIDQGCSLVYVPHYS